MNFFEEDNKTIWLLEPKENAPWPDYEPTIAIVVAEDELIARELAAKHSSIIWYDRYNTYCRPLNNKSFTKPEFIADAVPFHEEDILEATEDQFSTVTGFWATFLDIETLRPLHETDVAHILISYEEFYAG